MNTNDRNDVPLQVGDIVLHWSEEWEVIKINPPALPHQTAFATIQSTLNPEDTVSWPCNVLTKKVEKE